MELLKKDDRLALFPIRHPAIWEHYKKQRQCFWIPQEIDISTDVADWKTMSQEEQHFVKTILAFFAVSDGLVNFNLEENFIQEFSNREVLINYDFQKMMENIHNEMYSLFIETFIPLQERDQMIGAVEHFPTIRAKEQWMKQHMNRSTPIVMRLIAFAVVEGVFFSGSFCAIYWLKHRGLMSGLCKANEFIARDEGLHTDFACLLVSYFERPPSREVYLLFKEAVEIETQFITEALPCPLIGMNSTAMVQYIQYVADQLLVDLGYKPLYNTTNPFSFMNLLSLTTKTDFFASRPTEYTKIQNSQIDY
jgi:ribonucleoside-diphosphate reductase beta chain